MTWSVPAADGAVAPSTSKPFALDSPMTAKGRVGWAKASLSVRSVPAAT